MLELGVPEEQLRFVHAFTDKESFYAASEAMPQDAFEYLSWIVEGIPVDEVLEYAKEECGGKDAGGSISEALELPLSLKSFVVVEGEDELHRIMAEPLEKWRVFLHPTQRKIVNRDYSGPARVLGGAGTGKTVVAMHRAKHLASEIGSNERILFTTFTANLASDIRENLRKICTLEELRKIEVIHLPKAYSIISRDDTGKPVRRGYWKMQEHLSGDITWQSSRCKNVFQCREAFCPKCHSENKKTSHDPVWVVEMEGIDALVND